MYIVFEAIVGTGKTTQSKKLVEYLQKKYPERQVVWTREPGGSEIAEGIRRAVQGTTYREKMDAVCEAYLYAASRAQTLRKVVIPVIAAGGIVVSDRSFITSLAYQGYGRGLGLEVVLRINREALGLVWPDLVLYLDMDIRESVARTFDQLGDKFEEEGLRFFEGAVEGYRAAPQMPEFRGRWADIDASGTVEDVFGRIVTVVESKLRGGD